MRPFLLEHVFSRTALPCSGGYHLKREGMPLLDAVMIYGKITQLLKIKAQLSSIWAKGCILGDCVLSDIAGLPLLGGGIKSCYIIIIIIIIVQLAQSPTLILDIL